MFEECYCGSLYKFQFEEAAGCAQQVRDQERLANLDLEIPFFYRNLFSSVVLHSQDKTQSPQEFQKKLFYSQLARMRSSYEYWEFGVCLFYRVELLHSVEKKEDSGN